MLLNGDVGRLDAIDSSLGDDYILVSRGGVNYKIASSIFIGNKFVASIDSDYSVSSADSVILADASSQTIAVTLPVSPNQGSLLYIKKTNSGSNDVTVDGNGNNVEGLASQILTGSQLPSITIVFDGTEWWIL